MSDKVFCYKESDGEEHYIDPADYPNLNLIGGEMVDRNHPKVQQYFLSPERISERDRLIKFSKEAAKFFKE